MSVDSGQLFALANLSRLKLEPAQAPVLQAQINNIMALADALSAQNTEGVKPLAHPLEIIQAVQLRLREDCVCEPDARAANMTNAPAVQNNLFLVPKVID
ncbi:MAG: Asp-tRNA(Asn)/Glu-tRNA(Gln) amidotransferase subunit GatC [Limnobacter sp.]|nr:Asp-tRNA(Asn)/Glu-tRNA(Gln) amidotransferase subunit GatC [Limnobacter sp.]